MATPPKIPPDAFKQPGSEPESPFDTISSAPPPEKARGSKLALPTWNASGRMLPITHEDHAGDLDMDAAVNEYGLKMPRQQAEDEAYKQYLYHPSKGQHAQALRHHYLGMKAANATGDNEAAQKHSLMYGIHAKALGLDAGAAPPDLITAMQTDAPKMTKFKAHRGDAFAVNPPPQPGTGVISSAGPMTKSQRVALWGLYVAGQSILAKAEGDSPKREPRVVHGHPYDSPREKTYCGEYNHRSHYHRDDVTCPACREKMGSECPACKKMGKTFCMNKGEVVGEIPGPTVKQPPIKRKYQGFNDMDLARARKWAASNGYEDKSKPTKKGELSANKVIPCRCPAYHHPHRHGGGKCNVVKP